MQEKGLLVPAMSACLWHMLQYLLVYMSKHFHKCSVWVGVPYHK